MLSNCDTSSPSPNVNRSVNRSWCNTCTKWNTIDYTWTINNFSFRPEKNDEALISPTFSDGIHKDVKWKLQIYPKGDREDSKEFVSIFLELASSNKSEIEAKFLLAISTNTKKNLKSHKFEYKFKPGYWFGPPQFIEQDTLLDASNNLFPDDILIISCIIWYLSDSTNISGPSDAVQAIVPQSKLIQNLGNLFDNGDFSDVTIAVDHREIHAHKAVLTARSSYFAAMFKHQTQENRLNRIVVTDVDHDVFKEMLRFIYTDKAPNLNKMATKLLPVADKYALDRLKAMAEESLRVTMSIEDAIETLTLADRHNAVQLKSYAKEFIKSNISDVIETNGWENLIAGQIHQMLPSIEIRILNKENND